MSKSNAQKAREAAIADVQGMGIRAMILGGEYPVAVDDAVNAAKALNALAEAIRASAPKRERRKVQEPEEPEGTDAASRRTGQVFGGAPAGAKYPDPWPRQEPEA